MVCDIVVYRKRPPRNRRTTHTYDESQCRCALHAPGKVFVHEVACVGEVACVDAAVRVLVQNLGGGVSTDVYKTGLEEKCILWPSLP